MLARFLANAAHRASAGTRKRVFVGRLFVTQRSPAEGGSEVAAVRLGMGGCRMAAQREIQRRGGDPSNEAATGRQQFQTRLTVLRCRSTPPPYQAEQSAAGKDKTGHPSADDGAGNRLDRRAQILRRVRSINGLARKEVHL